VEAHEIGAALGRAATIVVNPENVVVLGGPDLVRELELELLAGDVDRGVAAGELRSESALDQRVDLGARVVLLGPQDELQRQPGAPAVTPAALEDPLLHRLQRRVPAIVGSKHRVAIRRLQARRALDPRREPLPGCLPEPGQSIGPLVLGHQPVVGEEYLIEHRGARTVGDRGSELRIAGRCSEQSVHLAEVDCPVTERGVAARRERVALSQ
jgi:hypothetical protein